MTTDEELIAQRRLSDARRFLVSVLDVENAPTLAPAMNALRRRVTDAAGWVSWSAALAAMLRASSVAVKTADVQLRAAIAAGFLARRGEYVRASGGKPAQDRREVILVTWPDTLEWLADEEAHGELSRKP